MVESLNWFPWPHFSPSQSVLYPGYSLWNKIENHLHFCNPVPSPYPYNIFPNPSMVTKALQYLAPGFSVLHSPQPPHPSIPCALATEDFFWSLLMLSLFLGSFFLHFLHPVILLDHQVSLPKSLSHWVLLTILSKILPFCLWPPPSCKLVDLLSLSNGHVHLPMCSFI